MWLIGGCLRPAVIVDEGMVGVATQRRSGDRVQSSTLSLKPASCYYDVLRPRGPKSKPSLAMSGAKSTTARRLVRKNRWVSGGNQG
jgi:hypothetical protein